MTALAALGLILGFAVAQVQAADSAQAAGGERVLSFAADYNLAPDGSMGVTETLVWQFGPGEHHGIKRNITVRQGVSSPPGKYRLYAMSDVVVSSPTGANSEVYVSELGADEVIRIGSPPVTFQNSSA